MNIVAKKQLNVLIQLAETDKHFAQAERDLILKIAKDNDFSEDDVRSLIRNPEPIDALGDLSAEQKFDYLVSCVRLIFADNKVFDKELIFAQSIATKLNFDINAVQDLIENLDKKDYHELKSKILTEYL